MTKVSRQKQFAASLEGPCFMQDCRISTLARGQATHARGAGLIARKKTTSNKLRVIVPFVNELLNQVIGVVEPLVSVKPPQPG